MKKLFVFYIVVTLFLLSGCQIRNGNVSSQSTETSNLAAITSDMGKTLNDLQLLHLSYDFLHLDGCNYSAESLGSPDGTFAYVFFGTQSGPGIEETASRYGNQLKCAGIYTTVDKVFSFTNSEPVSIEGFLSSIGLNINDSDRVNFWAGWVLFDYGNYSMSINTKDLGGADSGVYDIPKAKIAKHMPLIIMDKDLLSSNEKLCTENE